MPNSASAAKVIETRLRKELDRQVENLLHKGYPRLAGLSEQEFMKHIKPLKARIGSLTLPGKASTNGHIPFVIVIKNDLVSTELAMPRLEIRHTKGAVGMHPVEPNSFKPIDGLQIPTGSSQCFKRNKRHYSGKYFRKMTLAFLRAL